MLALISVSMFTAIMLMSATSLIIPAFAKKKHCDKSDLTCHVKIAQESPATQDNVSYTDSNIIDEDSNSDGYQTEPDSSTSSINSQDEDQLSPVSI